MQDEIQTQPDMRDISRCWISGFHAYGAGPCFKTLEACIKYRDEHDALATVATPKLKRCKFLKAGEVCKLPNVHCSAPDCMVEVEAMTFNYDSPLPPDVTKAKDDAEKTPESPRWVVAQPVSGGVTEGNVYVTNQPFAAESGFHLGSRGDVMYEVAEWCADGLQRRLNHLEGALREAEAKAALLGRLLNEAEWVYDSYKCNACLEYLSMGHAEDCPLEAARALQQPKAGSPEAHNGA